MNATKLMGTKLGFLCIAIVLPALGCETSSETAPAAVGAALPGPMLPQPSPTSPIKTPTLDPSVLCAERPDLNVQAQTVTNQGYKDWAYVCTPIKNSGGGNWSSNANQLGVAVSNSLAGSASGSGFATLSTGSSTTRCVWTRANGLLRMGHDTAKWGECQAELSVTTQLTFDPDILNDGNPANDDCLSSNNKRTTKVNIMQACPW